MSTIDIKWALDVVGQNKAKDVLATDRALRRSLEATDKMYAARGKVAMASEKTMTRAIEAERRATERAGRAAQLADRSIRQLGRSSSTSNAQLARGTRSISERATAYERLGREADQASRREVAAARRRASATRIAGGAARGIGRGASRVAGGVAAGLGFVGAFAGIAGAKSAISSTTELAHATLTLHKNLGLTIQRSSEWAAVAQARGVQSKQLAQAFGTLSKQVVAGNSAWDTYQGKLDGLGQSEKDQVARQKLLTQGATGSAAAFKQLGLTQRDLKSLSFDQVLGRVSDGLKKMGPGTDRTALSMKLFGRGWQTVVPLLRNGSKAMDDQLALARRYGVTFRGHTVKSLEEYIQAQRESKLATMGLKVAVGQFLIPTVTSGLKKVNAFIQGMHTGAGAGGRFADKIRPITRELRGIWNSKDLNFGDKLGKTFETVAPKIADSLAAAAPHAALAFVHAFKNAGIWGQLLTVTFLAKKLGAFGALGGMAAGLFKRGFGRGGGGAVGGAAGIVAGAKPIPVYVTNYGKGLPGGGPEPMPGPGGKGSKLAKGLKWASRLAPIAIAIDVLVDADAAGLTVKQERTQLKAIHEHGGGGSLSPKAMQHVDFDPGIAKFSGDLAKLDRQRASIARKFKGSPLLEEMLGKIDAQRAKLKSTIDYMRSAAVADAPKPLSRSLFLAADRVVNLRDRLHGLKKGTDAYKTTASQLRDAQAALNGAVRGGSSAFRGIAAAAGGAASAMNTAAATIDSRVATLASNLRSHGIAFNVSSTSRGRQAQDVTFGPIRRISPGDGGRRGGIASYAGGGMVPSFVSPGEMIVEPGGSSWTVPGARVAADNVFAQLPVGAAVLTGSGQAMLGAGASLHQALAMQAPHFQGGGRVLSPGQMATLAYRVGHVRPASEAIRMGAVGMRESHGKPSAHNYNPPRDDSWGLWQINVLPNANPQYRGWNLTNPSINATAMGQLHHRAGFRPWSGLPASSYSPWLDAARRGFHSDGTGLGGVASTSASTSHVPIFLRASRTRAGLLGDALSQGIDAGSSGLTRQEIAAGNRGTRGARRNPIPAAIRGAMTPTTRDLSVSGTGARSSTSSGGGAYAPHGLANLAGLKPHVLRGVGWAQSHGWRGNVTSGLRSRARQQYLWDNAPALGLIRGVSVAAPGTSMHERGLAVDVSDYQGFGRTQTSAPRNTRLLWRGMTDPVHFSTTGHRRGGLIRRYRKGGTAGGGISAGMTSLAAGNLQDLDRAVGQTTLVGLGTLYREVQRAAQKRGPKKVIQKLQGILDLIDFEIGRRIGRLYDQIQQRTARADRKAGSLDRVMRRQGIDAGSAEGLALQFGNTSLTPARRNVRQSRQALAMAKRTGNKDAIRQARQQLNDARDTLAEQRTGRVETLRGLIVTGQQEMLDARSRRIDRGRGALDRGLRMQGIDAGSAAGLGRQSIGDTFEVADRQKAVRDLKAALSKTKDRGTKRQLQTALEDAQDALDEALTVQAERRRDLIRAQAQERVDTTQFSLDQAQGGLGLLDVNQRLSQTADTPGGMLERARAIQDTLLPALRDQQGALQGQYDALTSIGDTTGARQALLAVSQAGTDIASAMADVADLVRQSGAQAAQEIVDKAVHGTTTATLGQTRLELQERIAGTFDAGGAQRADYILKTVVPALNAELVALRDQQATAAGQGDQKLADQIAEAIDGKTNDILQAQLDAQEQIADNTDPKQFGGTLGFGWGGETLTDSLVTIGNGV